MDNAKEGIKLWLETVIDDGGMVPEPKRIAEHYSNPEYAGWIWAVVSIDLAELSDKTERINISLPSLILRRLDALVSV